MTRKQTDALWAELDQRLDEALRDTFPASDPLSIEQPTAIGVLDDRFHETGIDGTGSVLVDSSFETERGVVSWQDGVRRSSWR
jgi:hypothetical protein